LPVLKKYIFEPTFGKDVKSQKEWKKFTCFTLRKAFDKKKVKEVVHN